MSDYENVLLVKNEVFVYKIPPRQSNRGYRAADWNLVEPFWTGRLRVIAKGQNLCIRLEDKSSGNLFANCPVDAFPGIAVESVLDSSRYFVVRLMDDTGRTMFTGIGFAERGDSFDLNVALSDHFKRINMEKEVEESTRQLANQPALNLSLKEGQKIKLNLKTARINEESGSSNVGRSKVSLGGTGGLLLPPPPPAASRSTAGRSAIGNKSSSENQFGAASVKSEFEGLGNLSGLISPNSGIADGSNKNTFDELGSLSSTKSGGQERTQVSSNADLLDGLFGGTSTTAIPSVNSTTKWADFS